MNISKLVMALSLGALLGLPACNWFKLKKTDTPVIKKTTHMHSDVDMPLAQERMDSFFDDEINEYTPSTDIQNAEEDALEIDQIDLSADSDKLDDFAWVKEEKHEEFMNVYFDFDRSEIRADQEEAVAHNIAVAKKALADNPALVVSIEGHADHAAGSDAYNHLLSEQRAKVLQNRLVAAGIPADRIKIVGRGNEMPAIIDGKPVHGDRHEQWANRRDEVRLLIS